VEIIDIEAFERAAVRSEPCDFIVVPGFIKSEALEAVNRDYPKIDGPGNFDPDQLVYGSAFQRLLEELNSPALKKRYSEKFDLDLTPYPLQMTIRKYSDLTDGNVHNDSKSKIITTLIYFNEEWPHEGGKLRLLHSSWNIDNYAAEVEPVRGTLIAFRRNECSFHGFRKMEGERRSLQMYWVKPKRASAGGNQGVGIKKLVKRIMKHRPRW